MDTVGRDMGGREGGRERGGGGASGHTVCSIHTK